MQTIFATFEYIRFAALTAALGYAAVQDYRHGKVENNVWKYAAIALPLTFAEYAFYAPSLLWIAAVSTVLSIVLAFGLFYAAAAVKQPWGGADTKALILIGCAMPLTPILWQGSYLTFTPLLALFLGCIFALWAAMLRRKKHLRFLPYLFVGLILACLI
jgi:hypothetical protein